MSVVSVKNLKGWTNIVSDNGDIDIVPIGEIHVSGKSCSCRPSTELHGSVLVILHQSFDHREIVEQAIAIMNGDA